MTTKAEGKDSDAPAVNPWTHNVKCGIAVTALYTLGANLFSLTVLPSFIFDVGGSNFAVGFVEGCQGIANLIFAVPTGYVADKYSRRLCLRVGVIIFCVYASFLLTAVATAEDAKDGSTVAFRCLIVALCCLGICDAVIAGPMIALIDDSCPAGYRSTVETTNAIGAQLASCAGPIVGLVVFLFRGDDWTLPAMKTVITTGVCLSFLAVGPLIFMDDRKALGKESEAVHLQHNSSDSLALRSQRRAFCGLVTPSRVRPVLFLAEFFGAFGAGMTVKFFPVFFDQVVQIRPSVLQAVVAALSLLVAGGMYVANFLSKRVGRMQVVIPFAITGNLCSILMGLHKGWQQSAWLMIFLFMLRNVAQWSVLPLLGSVIADYTPKATRGRWKAASSILSCGWSGSALFGGWCIDQFGFGPTFVITGCIQLLCIPIYVLLTPLIAKESELQAMQADSSNLGTSLQPQQSAEAA